MSTISSDRAARTHTFDLHVRGSVPPQLAGSLIIPASRRIKDRRVFSRWHDAQTDLIRLDVEPGNPGRIHARILAVDPSGADLGPDFARSAFEIAAYANDRAYGYATQPNHAINVAGNTAWATNLLFGAPLEIDLERWEATRLLRYVQPQPDAPRVSTTAHFAWSFDRRYAYFHQSLLTRERTSGPVEARDLRLVELDVSTGTSRTWVLEPPRDDSRLDSANFHSAFYFEEHGRRFVGLLRTGAVLQTLAPHETVTEHAVSPSPVSEIWIVELKRESDVLRAQLLDGIKALGGVALSHLDVDADADGFVLFANCKQADVAEETHGVNIYGEPPEAVTEQYNGMIVEPFDVGLVLRYERRRGVTSLRTFRRGYDPAQTSLGHSWLPINVLLDASRTSVFCTFYGFRPRLLPKHIADAYRGAVSAADDLRYIPPVLMRLDARTLEPEYDAQRSYLSYAEPMPTAVCGTASSGYVATFSPEIGLRVYRADNLNHMVCHAVSAELEHWRDSHFRPEPAHMVFVPR